jgi:hypothetical protein
MKIVSSPFAHPLLAGLTLNLALAACGSVDPQDHSPGAAGDTGAPSDDTPLLPWATGNSWSYRVTKDGEVTDKTTTVGELEVIGGSGPHAEDMAYHVVTAKGVDEKDRTESWQAPDADYPQRIVRYRELSFGAVSGELELEEHWEPAKLHIDGTAEKAVAGASWLEKYAETKLEVGLPETSHEVREVWTVVDDDVTLEVPKGTFQHVIHFQKSGSGATKNYWYLRGVGKLKETGSQTEELVDYSLEDAAP